MEHKFKVWDTEKKRWLSDIERCYLDDDGDVRIERSSYAGTWLERVRGEVVLFIGLKDKNGIDIYKGDILKTFWQHDGATNYDYELTGVVIWNAEKLQWSFEIDKGDEVWIFPLCSFEREEYFNEETEILGNIYQCPELLSPNTTQKEDK